MSKPTLDEAMRKVAEMCANNDKAWGAWLVLHAYLAAQAEWPSEEDVRKVVAKYQFCELPDVGKDDIDAMRTALQSVRPPATHAHLAECPSEQLVEIAGEKYSSVAGAYSKTAMRAALKSVRASATNLSEVSSKVVDAESVRPPVVDSALLLYAHNHAEKSVGSEGVRFELRFAPLESGGGLRDYLIAASRHAPTKDGLLISRYLWCECCKAVTEHEKRAPDVCCKECHSIAVSEHNAPTKD